MKTTVRVDKLLSNLGYGSRRDIHDLARRQRIVFRGQAVEGADRKLSYEDATDLEIDGETIDPLPGLVLMLNKPVGVTCSHKESGPLVYDLLPSRWRRRDPKISSAGRLDKETSGLLLMTDDGALLHRIVSPKAHVPKRYRVRLARPLEGDETAVFESGQLVLEGERAALLPARLEVSSPTEADITIVEGRYHQVRRMFAAVGNHVEALHRRSVGNLAMPDDLSPGEFRRLASDDVAMIFAVAAN